LRRFGCPQGLRLSHDSHELDGTDRKIGLLDSELSACWYRNPITMDDFIRDIFLAFIRIHLLHHAAEAPFYGAEMLAELARHGYSLSPGTLYPILHAMEAGGYLECERSVVEGKVRKYYRATPQGREALIRARAQIRELVEEVLPEEASSDLEEIHHVS
jgi:DNA-binding PadR family transcriptional regulator